MAQRVFETIVFTLLIGGMAALFGAAVVSIWGDAEIASKIAVTSVVSIVAGFVFGQGL
jgi:hypothetical protein